MAQFSEYTLNPDSALAKAWAVRFGATLSTLKGTAVTLEDMEMEATPQEFDEFLDHLDEVSERIRRSKSVAEYVLRNVSDDSPAWIEGELITRYFKCISSGNTAAANRHAAKLAARGYTV